jgi:hypothetical protein
MTKQLPFSHSEIDLDNFVKNGSLCINYKIDGYWSNSTITVYTNIRHDFKNKNYYLESYVSHSTGGRDKGELEDDSQATRNFANALLHAADLADELKCRTDIIPVYVKDLKERIAEEKKLREQAEEKRRQRDIDNPPMGLTAAKKLINELIERAETSHMEFYDYDVRSRYSDEIVKYKIEVSVHERKKFWFKDKSIGRQKLIELLSEKYALIS